MTRILCVEDNDDNLYMLHRRLSRAGFEVKVATNGAEAVEWAKGLQPDIIVMDLNLPKLNGWEATRQLKGQEETKHIPIIVLSANTGDQPRERAFAAGCDDFETKPADFDRLIGKIRTLLAAGAKE
ncbi:MAG TPA: response regulator [Burkholderiales bacterium]|jgi:CheY-like chemotaxis protein|nr:response regulator [Burkholderiales bacterium]